MAWSSFTEELQRAGSIGQPLSRIYCKNQECHGTSNPGSHKPSARNAQLEFVVSIVILDNRWTVPAQLVAGLCHKRARMCTTV